MDHINDFLEHRIAGVRADNREILEIFNKCESPIEQLFFLAYLWTTNPYPVGDGSLIDRMDHMSPGAYVRIEPQRQLELEGSKYRVDFSFELCGDSVTDSRNVLKHLIVEADGHDFHERTKEQASRDRSRDRTMARAGILVLRFTGSEIYRSAINAAIETRRMLSAEIYARIGA